MSTNRNHAIQAIERAIDEKRLTHALLLQGRNAEGLRSASMHIASKLLGVTEEKLLTHPDFHMLQARNKMRQISVDHTRELIRSIQHSPNAGERKVALVLEVDRMNQAAANAFLKTLEEPPRNTSIILTTNRPNALLDTIISRCLSFWFGEPEQTIEDPQWMSWQSDFQRWLEAISQKPETRQDITSRVMRMYALMEGVIQEAELLASKKTESEGSDGNDYLDDDERIAMEVGAARQVKQRLLADVEMGIRSFAMQRIRQSGDADAIDQVSEKLETSVRLLERLRGLLELNLSDSKMLEAWMLNLLRIWSPRN